MPLRKKVISVVAAAAAFVVLAAVAANLNDLDLTTVPSETVSVTESITGAASAAESVTDVTVSWRTDWDDDLGAAVVVGATLVPAAGVIHSTSTVAIAIADAAGAALGTITSVDGGETWSVPAEAVDAADATAAAVVINDGETIAAVTSQN